MAVSAQRQVRLGNLRHVDGGLHAAVDALLLEEVLQCKGIHYRAQHAHVVRASTIHAALGKLRATEEVSAADNHCNLDSLAGNLGDLAGYVFNHVWVDTDLAAAEHLTAQLQHYSLVSGSLNICSSHAYFVSLTRGSFNLRPILPIYPSHPHTACRCRSLGNCYVPGPPRDSQAALIVTVSAQQSPRRIVLRGLVVKARWA